MVHSAGAACSGSEISPSKKMVPCDLCDRKFVTVESKNNHIK